MKIPVHNPHAMPIYVGVNMILPGETRHFDEQDVPTHLRPKAQEATAAPAENVQDLIADLQKLAVKEILLALPDLADEDIDRLEAMENATGAPRKSLSAAITDEKLKRAAANEEAKSPAGDPGAGGSSD